MIDIETAKQYLPRILNDYLDWACISDYKLSSSINPEDYLQEYAPHNFFVLTKVPGLDLTPLVEGIADRLPQMDVARGSISGYFIGLLGEYNFSTKRSTIAVLDHFIKCIDLCISYKSLDKSDIEKLIKEHPNEFKASIQMPLLSTAIMSRITTDREYRDYLRNKRGVSAKINQIASNYGNCGYIPKVLAIAEKETVYFLHFENNRGCEVEIEQMDNNFQLFTWFQMELYHQNLLNDYGITNFNYNSAIDNVLHRNFESNCNFVNLTAPLIETAIFGYNMISARTVDENGVAKYKKDSFIIGEENIYSIPKIDGKFVILLTKDNTILNSNTRSWNGAYIGGVHQNLFPRLKIIRQLTQEELDELKTKIDRH